MKGVCVALCCVLLLGYAGVAYSGGCGFAFRGYSYSYPISYVAPVAIIKQAPVYYELGAPVQVAAKQTYAMRTDPSYDRFLQFKAFEAGYVASQQQAAAQQVRGVPQQYAQQGGQQYTPNGAPQQRNTPLIVEHCANCHGAQLEQPKAGLVLDPRVGLSGEQITEVVKRMRLPENHPDVMPPAPAKLAPEVKGGILEEVLQLHSTPNLKGGANGPQVQPLPVPQSPQGAGG